MFRPWLWTCGIAALGSAGSLSAQLKVPIAAHVVSFLQPGPTGTIAAATLFERGNAASEADASATERSIGSALAAGRATIHARRLILNPLSSLVARFAANADYTTYGTEICASGTVDKLACKANYTWTQTDHQVGTLVQPIPYALSPKSTTPVHKANVALSYDIGRLSLSGVTRYTSATRQFAFFSGTQLLLYRVGDAVAVDARAGFRLTPVLEICVVGENLTLPDGAAVSLIPADRRARVGVRLAL